MSLMPDNEVTVDSDRQTTEPLLTVDPRSDREGITAQTAQSSYDSDDNNVTENDDQVARDIRVYRYFRRLLRLAKQQRSSQVIQFNRQFIVFA